jgi:hypothetical protein
MGDVLMCDTPQNGVGVLTYFCIGFLGTGPLLGGALDRS